MTRVQRNLAYQGLALLVSFAAAGIVVMTASANLADRGIELGTSFLGDRAGFTLSETWLRYSADDSNAWALVVGIGNTLVVSALVALLSTAAGTALGILRTSENPLANAFARTWIEIARNSPPILLLLFLYSVLGQILPVASVVEPVPGTLLSLRGLAIPWVDLGNNGGSVFVAATLSIVCLVIAAKADAGRQRKRGQRPKWLLAMLGVLVLAWATAFAIWIGPATTINRPQAIGADIAGGVILTPEFFTLAAGLTFYTSGFVAEIVRTGLQSVTRGQWEAAAALGLSKARTLRLVIIPQMLRVIIPPMTSQYINVVKNSTLVIAIGYADFMVVAGTVINKTSHAIEGTVIIIIVYLAINLTLSAAMNAINRRIQADARP